MSTRIVTASIQRIDGTPWANFDVRFTLQPSTFGVDASYPENTVLATTDAAGTLAVTLVSGVTYLVEYPGVYVITGSSTIYPRGSRYTIVTPAGAGTVSLKDLQAAPGISPTTPSVINLIENTTGPIIADVSALEIELALKADQSATDAAIFLKADSAAVSILSGRVGDVEVNTEGFTAALSAKADSASVAAIEADGWVTTPRLAPAVATAVDAVATKADAVATTASLALKAETSTMTSALALKANDAETTTALATKASATSVTSLSTAVARVDPGALITPLQRIRRKSGDAGLSVDVAERVNVRDYGATGDGVTNDTAALHLARDSGAKRFYLPAGTYLAALVLNVAGQTWELDRDATIIAPAALAEFGAAVSVSANDVSILGNGKIDGNRANQAGANVFGVFTSGDRLRWDGPSILSAKKHGLVIYGGTGHTVKNLSTKNTGQNGINATPIGKHMDDCAFERIVCDRTGEAAGYLQGGFKLIGTSTYQVRRPYIRDVRGILPDPSVTASTSANGNVSVELWYIEDGRVDDLYSFGGWIGLSFAYACKRNAIGKVVGEKALSNCVEFSGPDEASSGRDNAVGQIIANGGGVTRRPVTLLRFDDWSIDSIVVTNGGVNDGGNLSNLVYIHSCDRLKIGRIVGRMDTATGTGNGAWFESCTDLDVGPIDVDDGTGVTTGRAIRIFNCSGVSISGGKNRGFPNDIMVSINAAGTYDDIVVMGFRFNTGAVESLVSTGTEGNNVRFLGCPKLVRNGKSCDILDRKGDIIRAWGTGTPEAVVSAGIGSEFMRTDGGAGTSGYRKESGTGNTGWVAK